MSERERKDGPRKSGKGAAAERERHRRQAEQLRANLLKRKAQSRARADRVRPADEGGEGPSEA